MDSVIKIEPHNCSECYRCIRACRIKAIEVVDNQAIIRQEECTGCGECLTVCPHDMITLRDDIGFVKRLIKRSDRVVVSLHWSWNSEFAGIAPYRIIEALRLLGFMAVSETLLGSEYYEECIVEKMHEKPVTMISVECPVAVKLIENRYAELVKHLPPIASPAILHSRMLKAHYGSDTKVVHIASCVAMKTGNEIESEIDAVLTFKELRQWMWDDGVEFDFIPGNDSYHFEPYAATHVRGATIDALYKRVVMKGFNRISQVMQNIDKITDPLIIELWSCSGGCLEGAGSTTSTPLITKTLVQKYPDATPHAGYIPKRVPFKAQYRESLQSITADVAESQIERALRDIGKFRPVDYHNCNACGYETCRDFARAMVESRAESSMCMSYSRNLAQKKFTALLGKMPSGVMLVDSNLCIIEANQNMADILGADAQLIFGVNQGMKGADLEKFISFTSLLSSCLVWNKDRTDEEVQIGDKMYRASLFTIEPHKVICVVINSLMINNMINEQMTARTRAVIRENLDAVQKIAYLLGETASRTEAVLNSIIETRGDA